MYCYMRLYYSCCNIGVAYLVLANIHRANVVGTFVKNAMYVNHDAYIRNTYHT
jgi:hypothetical protein